MPTGLRYDGVISYREGFEYPEECQKCLGGTESCAMRDCILDIPHERLHGELPEGIFEEFQRLFDCSSRDALTRYSDIKVSDEANFDETKKRMWMSVHGTSEASGIEVVLCPRGDFHLAYGVEYLPETMALKASFEDILQKLREDSLSDKQ